MPKLFDKQIIQDVLQEIEGDSSPASRQQRLLMAILVELRILNGRSADEGDKKIRKGAESALRNLSNYRV